MVTKVRRYGPNQVYVVSHVCHESRSTVTAGDAIVFGAEAKEISLHALGARERLSDSR